METFRNFCKKTSSTMGYYNILFDFKDIFLFWKLVGKSHCSRNKTFKFTKSDITILKQKIEN